MADGEDIGLGKRKSGLQSKLFTDYFTTCAPGSVSQGCFNSSTNWEASTKDTCCLTVLEAEVPDKMLAELVPSEGCEGESVPGLFLWLFTGNLKCSLACRCITLICTFIFT